MAHLEKFDVSKNTKSYRNALAETIGGVFLTWGSRLAGTLSDVFVTSRKQKGKNQISKTLARYEKKLRRIRKI